MPIDEVKSEEEEEISINSVSRATSRHSNRTVSQKSARPNPSPRKKSSKKLVIDVGLRLQKSVKAMDKKTREMKKMRTGLSPPRLMKIGGVFSPDHTPS